MQLVCEGDQLIVKSANLLDSLDLRLFLLFCIGNSGLVYFLIVLFLVFEFGPPYCPTGKLGLDFVETLDALARSFYLTLLSNASLLLLSNSASL